MADTLEIRPWPDPVIDSVGLDPRSHYVEEYWLSILGPSTTWLIRRLARGLEASPAGFTLSLDHTARALGLAATSSKHSPFARALTRCVQFDLAQDRGDDVLAVRRKVPPLSRRQIIRLPPDLKKSHDAWQAAQLQAPTVESQRRRARQLALSLFELGEDLETAERQLLRWKFHPAMAHEAAAWGWDRHRSALAAADA
ncbi:MAG TPA: hypothetical protein VFB78_16355 [Acidimicrobiales bacterium]|nr:hypothetical protein [Acidimicrobiales bacterium]